jgi:hypothetical protein
MLVVETEQLGVAEIHSQDLLIQVAVVEVQTTA